MYFDLDRLSLGTMQQLIRLCWLHTVFLTYIFSVCNGYPSGVPDLACESMFPVGHQASAAGGPSPYNITMSKFSYKPGETVQVNVRSNVGDFFTGLYVQARRVGCLVNTTQTVGVFTCTSDLVQTRHCFGKIHTAVSHTSPMEKYGASFYWTAPVFSSGHVVMRVTIVKNRTVFWTNLESAPLIDLQERDMPYCIENLHKKIAKPNKDKTIYDKMKHIVIPKHFGDKNGSVESSTHCFSYISVSVFLLCCIGYHVYR